LFFTPVYHYHNFSGGVIWPDFDQAGFQQDWNIVFPLDRLKEPASEGVIGNVADLSVMLIRLFGSLLLVPMSET
jgi:hypothetical protein